MDGPDRAEGGPDDPRPESRTLGDLLERVLNRLETASGQDGERNELSRAIEELRDGLALAAPAPGPAGVDPNVSLDAPPDGADSPPDLLEALSERREAPNRYRSAGELGRGGMGVVLRIWDSWLRRTLARKTIHRMAPDPHSTLSRNMVTRFLEEAQVAAQLDHPGILPVHDIGVDDHGLPFFTMQLVRGRSLKEVYERFHAGDEAGDERWTRARIVGALLRIAEAMAYAHSKGVIHRDLKPANVMVGRFGEVYVMDWGLAKLVGRDEGDVDPGRRRISTSRTTDSGSSPLLTASGSAVGTPAYMAPEQAFGSVDELGPRADVYALGSMLYHLLAGAPPYADLDWPARDPTAVVRAGAPTALATLAPDAPAELVAITERAMEREPRDRYPTMEALGADLRAWIEGRVVAAYEGGAWAELRKWVGRNQALAATALAAMLVLVVGAATTTVGFLRASERADDVLRLSAIQDLEELVERADRLWPAEPGRLEDLREWVRDAEALLAQRPLFEARRDSLRARSRPPTAEETAAALAAHPSWDLLEIARSDLGRQRERLGDELADAERARVEAWIDRQESLIHELETEIGDVAPWRFDRPEDQWWHDRLSGLIEGLDRMADPELGLLSGFPPEHGPGVVRRIAAAERSRELARSPDVERRWKDAITSIADAEDCPLYGGLEIERQSGLIPLWRDPRTGLWEFWHVASGDEPTRDEERRIVLTEDSGFVFVLIPGGRLTMGSQRSNPLAPNYDLASTGDEQPLQEIDLDPFFLSKYEATQAQWERLTGSNPSQYSPANEDLLLHRVPTLLHPVERIAWTRVMLELGRRALTLPTEAQWEYAARAGTDTPWWTGETARSLQGKANAADLAAQDVLPEVAMFLDDGYQIHAPVDAFPPNPWGLVSVHGNVMEWCRDRLGGYASDPVRPGTGERLANPGEANRTARGGSCVHLPEALRSAARYTQVAEHSGSYMGFRPARILDRETGP